MEGNGKRNFKVGFFHDNMAASLPACNKTEFMECLYGFFTGYYGKNCHLHSPGETKYYLKESQNFCS